MNRIGLYSLIAFAFLALIGVGAVGISGALNRGDDAKIEQADTPTVATPPTPETTSETSEKTKEEEKENKKENKEKRKAERKKAEKVAQEKKWREIAERRDAEEKAAEREAAKQEEVQTEMPTSTALSLSAPTAGIQNDSVTNSMDEGVLANGAGKLPSTGFPWQEGANTYIAAHVYGYPGTSSWQQFAKVPNMAVGDPIYLTDSSGTTYEYQVSEILTVAPTDVWVAESTGQSIVSLQTCVGPNWSQRLVVRGSLVGKSQA